MSTLDKPTRGKVLIDGHDVNRMSVKEMHRFRNQHIGFVFQFHYLLPELTAIENVLLPAMKAKGTASKRERAKDLLNRFGLLDKADRLPGQLSGGEQQRVGIARALIMSPKYLFADEPTGNLDSVNSEAVLSLLEQVNREEKTTIVMVTHDLGFAKRAHRMIQLVDGHIT
jgi:putative ABC transport system ATP-binding protein/lipoprotein-releasing system ATP-binding protein